MRNADLATLVRVGIVFVILYLVLIKSNPFVSIILFAFAFVLDAIDGYFAVNESSAGKIGIVSYLKSVSGNAKLKKQVAEVKSKTSSTAKYGARLDIAADRIVEYAFWMLFTYLHIIPFFVLVIIVARHSFVDAFMGIRGTSSKMKTTFAKLLYSSNVSRALANILKFVTFSYLILEYVYNYPSVIGNILVAVLTIFIVVRGIAELYETIS